MLVKNLTPFVHATKLTSRRPPRPEMTLVVKGTFTLRASGVLEPLETQPPLTAELFADDDVERLGECLYPGDFADFKLRAEVMLRGACHAPPGRALTESRVRFAVGDFVKELRVLGARVWKDGLVGSPTSEPLPFRRMDLSYANAFGGPGAERNPVGKGQKGPEAPNVEHPDAPLHGPTQRARPATFAPVNPLWPYRAGKVGKEYGRRWREERAPYYAEDFDWSYFQAAPRDQQLPHELRGDERLELDNLHATHAHIRCRLPGLRVRAFVHDVGGHFRETPMRLDTLFVDTDAEQVVLLWRGVEPVREPDFIDVTTIYIASERLEDAPLATAHYRTLVDEFEQDPLSMKGRVPDGFEWMLTPPGRPPPEPPPADLDPISALLRRKLGKGAPELQARVAETMKTIGDASPEAKAAFLQAVDRASEPLAEPPVPATRKHGAMPPLGLRHKMRQVLAKAAEAKASFAGRPMPGEVAQKVAELERMPFAPMLSELDPGYRPPVEPVSTDEPGPYRDLSEQDLTGRDLRGVDLTGAKLEDTILSGADLSGAKLAGANLRRAVLFRAKLAGADLSGADLTQANLAAVEAPGVVLRDATLDLAFFEAADLTGADLRASRGEYTVFVQARLDEAKLDAARIDHADFTGGSLERASLVHGSFPATHFEACRGAGLDLSHAALDGARFPAAELTGARFIGARGERTYWAAARLDRADLHGSSFCASHFPEISAVGASFARATLTDSRFYRARLERTSFVEANLFAADFSRANLKEAHFQRANLYDAKFLEASGKGCDFTDANVTRATMRPS